PPSFFRGLRACSPAPVAQPRLGDAAQGRQPHVYPLDRLSRRVVAVGPLMLAVEGLQGARDRIRIRSATRERDGQLETLPDVTQLRVVLEEHVRRPEALPRQGRAPFLFESP